MHEPRIEHSVAQNATGSVRTSDVRTLIGTIIDGKVATDGELHPEGATVTIIVHDDVPPELSPEQVQELKDAIADMERGDYITAEELMNELRNPTPRR